MTDVTDSIDDSDVRRINKNVTGEALNQSQIEQELPDSFSSSAKSAFAERLAGERAGARQEFQDQVSFQSNASTGATQIQTESGQFGPAVENVTDTRVDPSDGGVYVDASNGESYRVGTIDTGDRPTRTTPETGDWSG